MPTGIVVEVKIDDMGEKGKLCLCAVLEKVRKSGNSWLSGEGNFRSEHGSVIYSNRDRRALIAYIADKLLDFVVGTD